MVIEMKQSTNTNIGVGNEENKTGGWICHKSSQTMAALDAALTRNDTPCPKDKRVSRNSSPLSLETNVNFCSHDRTSRTRSIATSFEIVGKNYGLLSYFIRRMKTNRDGLYDYVEQRNILYNNKIITMSI